MQKLATMYFIISMNVDFSRIFRITAFDILLLASNNKPGIRQKLFFSDISRTSDMSMNSPIYDRIVDLAFAP
jgi:hypothetical protein